jgi:tetratricopeptide (TPR) repeat protein
VVAQFEAGLAEILTELGRPAEALARNRHALGELEQDLGARHPQIAIVLNNVGDNLASLGRTEEAFDYHRKALEMIRLTSGAEPNYKAAFSAAGAGDDLLTLGRPREARRFLEEALRAAASRPNDAHLLARIRFLLARALYEGGTRSGAMALANAARVQFASEGIDGRDELQRVETWLQSARTRSP